MKRRFPIDWKMVLGFGGLLLLVAVIGLIGVRQIEMLNRTVTHLARVDIPLQNAVQEMKSNNSKYAIGIRSYIFWKSARYLDAAAVAKTDLTKKATENFEESIAFYASMATTAEERGWITTARDSEGQLRAIGDRIMRLADASAVAEGDAKTDIINDIRRTLMEFESKLFQIEAYLDETLQKHNLRMIDEQLMRAQASRDRSVRLLFGSLAVALALGAQMAYLTYRRSKRDSEHRELLCRTVIRVEEEQKNNLSLQVHDQMGQDLSAMKIYLGLIDGDLPEGAAEQKDRINKSKRIVDALMQKIHNISELLRPPELDDLGLIESLEALIGQYRELTNCKITFNGPDQELKLSPEYSLVLYRVVQEALTNVAKHAKARSVDINLLYRGNSARLSVLDDGTGFDCGSYAKRPHRRRDDVVKLGLQGLRERIELFGGRMHIRSRPGVGTLIQVDLPIF